MADTAMFMPAAGDGVHIESVAVTLLIGLELFSKPRI